MKKLKRPKKTDSVTFSKEVYLEKLYEVFTEGFKACQVEIAKYRVSEVPQGIEGHIYFMPLVAQPIAAPADIAPLVESPPMQHEAPLPDLSL